MTRFKAIHLRNVLFYKKASIRLDKNPLTFIYGRNWNSSGSTNAAGKSLLFSQIPELIFGEPIIGVKRDRLRNGSVALDLESKGVNYRVVRVLKNGKETMRVLREGEDMVFRELVEARKFVQKLVGCNSPEEFESRIYIDVQAAHPLIRGDTAARKRFFTEFFRLNMHDGMLAIVRQEMRLAADAVARREVLAANLQEERSRLAAYEKVLDEDVAKHESRAKLLSSTIDDLRSVASLYDRVRHLDEAMVSKARKMVGKPFTAARLKEVMSAYSDQLQEREDQLDRYEQYRDAASRLKVLREEIQALEADAPSDEDKAKITKLTALVERIAELEKQQRDLSAEIGKVEDEIDSIEVPPKTCSKCGQPWPHKHDAKANVERKANLRIAFKDLTEQARVLSHKLKDLREKKNRVEGLAIRTDEYARRFDKLRSQYRKAKETAGEKVEEPDREGTKALRSQLRFLQEHRESIHDLIKYQSLSESDRKEAERLDELVSKHLRLVEKLAQMRHHKEERTLIKRRIVQIKQQIQEADKRTEDVENLKILAQAYSKKGVPNLMIRAICARLEEVVNKYASFLFSEDYSFSFQLDTQFVISVTRQYQGSTITSDVRKLSGAETRLFSILLLLGLLTFVPKARRTNLLVLDEPDASMGDENIELLMRFLAVLNKVIPNIVVITPKKYDIPENAVVYTVVKKGTESRLVNGSA